MLMQAEWKNVGLNLTRVLVENGSRQDRLRILQEVKDAARLASKLESNFIST